MPDFLGGDYLDETGQSTPYTGDYDFTSETLMRQYMGDEGIDMVTDDLASNTSAINKAILEAEDYMMQYLLNRYEPEDLRNVSWMERRCTELAVFFLFHRRGQDPPQALHASVLRIERDLEGILDAKLQVPGAATRKPPTPVLSTYTVDNRKIRNRGRVVQRDSVGTHPTQPMLRDYYGQGER